MVSSISKGPLLLAARANTTLLLLYPTIAPCQCRQFSLSSQLGALQRMPETVRMKQPAQPSQRLRQKTLSRAELPQDIGLLPGTFVRPLWRDMPSIFQQPKERLQLEWLWVKTGFQNFLGLFVYSKFLIKGLPLRLKERRQVAREYHQRMYSAFADGDKTTLRKICCTGLANSLISRIANRPRGEKVTWSLDKYIRSPSTLFTGIRVVSDRATQIPELPDSGVRQVVLRIRSRQSTSKVQKQPSEHEIFAAEVPAETPAIKQQDCTEYIVLQKFRWTGQEDEWRIWGHTTPTTVDDLSNPFFASGLTIADRMEAAREMMQGKK